MFEDKDLRFRLVVLFIVLYSLLYLSFSLVLPYRKLDRLLKKIELSIVENNWEEATLYTNEYTKVYTNKRIIIQMNNSTEALVNYEQALGQLQLAVKQKDKNAMEYVGALKEVNKYVVIPFAGP